jgi:hypothetical protein
LRGFPGYADVLRNRREHVFWRIEAEERQIMTPDMNEALVNLVRAVTTVVILGFIGAVYHFCG